MSHICIANLLRKELYNLNENDLIISIDLLDEFTQFVIFDSSGPLLIKRLASIRNYPSINEIKEINNKQNEKNKKSNDQNKSNNYHALSKLDLKVLLREINVSFNDFLNKNNLNKKGKIFLSGRNSQHKNLVEILGENLKMDVALISPINSYNLKEFSYNPDEINHFSMARIIGLGLTLIKDYDLEEESLNNGFIVKRVSFDKNIDEEIKDNVLAKNMNKKEKLETKTKIEKKKNELPSLPNINKKDKIETKTKIEKKKNELPPLPNINKKDKIETKTKIEEKKNELPPLPNINKKDNTKITQKDSLDKKEKLDIEEKNNNKKVSKSFKMDKSFLKDD